MPLLRRIPLLVCSCAFSLASLAVADGAQGQAGPEVTADRNPSQLAQFTLSGDGLTIWAEPDGTRLLVYKGNFTAQGPAQSLSSDRAVIWLKQTRRAGQIHSSLRLYLEGKVKVRESSGAVTTDEVLLSRLEVAGPLAIKAVQRTDQPQRDDPLYQRAVETLRESGIDEPITAEGIAKQDDPNNSKDDGDIEIGSVKVSRGPVFMRGSMETCQSDNEFIFTLVADDQGQVYVSQAATKSELLLEMQADAAVLFRNSDSSKEDGETGGTFAGVYLEGHVLIRQGERTIRAKKLYYDFRYGRALILDGVLRTIDKQRKVPLYMRGKEIRQLSETEFQAKKATLTSSDFERPDFHLAASRVQLSQRTRVDKQGRPILDEYLHVRADNLTMNIGWLPIFWWPVFVADLGRGELPIQSVKFGESASDGFGVETDWWLFRLLGLETPENVRAILGLDYMTKRGPAVRLEVDYKRDKYEGYFRGYLIDDHGQDQLSRSREDIEPLGNLRGRALLRHRHYLPQDWEMQLEASYISDPTWLEQYEEREFDTGKDQETPLYLKKQRQNWAFSMLTNSRLMDFISLTEHLPEGRFVLIGEPLGNIASGFVDVRGGVVSLRANNMFGPPLPLESSKVLRGDARVELDLPLQLGGLKLVPYISARGTSWDDSPMAGGEGRYFATAGVRAGTQFWRVYDKAESRILDLYQIRHIIEPQVHIFGSTTNHDHGSLGVELWPFDQDVEGLHNFSAVSVALLQTLQTKRGPPGARRSVDWLNLDVRATFFDRQDPLFGSTDFSDSAWPTNMARAVPRGRWFDYRPENSIPRDHVQTDLSLRLSDTTMVFADATYGTRPQGFDRVNVGLAVTRSPRLSYFVADRFDRGLDMQVFTAGGTYRINEKYSLSGAHQLDFDNGRGLATSLSLVRKFPRWYLAVTVEVDETRDNSAITISIWPEGTPEVKIGARAVGGVVKRQ